MRVEWKNGMALMVEEERVELRCGGEADKGGGLEVTERVEVIIRVLLEEVEVIMLTN